MDILCPPTRASDRKQDAIARGQILTAMAQAVELPTLSIGRTGGFVGADRVEVSSIPSDGVKFAGTFSFRFGTPLNPVGRSQNAALGADGNEGFLGMQAGKPAENHCDQAECDAEEIEITKCHGRRVYPTRWG